MSSTYILIPFNIIGMFIETARYIKIEARDFNNLPYKDVIKSESVHGNKLRKQEPSKLLILYHFENKLYLGISEILRVA